jgi:hypothetical protein
MRSTRAGSIARGLRITTLAAGACYVVLLVVVQSNEWVTRKRAERLLAEMSALKVGQSTWSDLVRIQTRWGAWGSYEGKCEAKSCEYHVEIMDMGAHPDLRSVIAWAGHSHMATAELRISVEDGIVRGSYFQLMVIVPSGYGPRWEADEMKRNNMTPYSTTGMYTLIARTGSSGVIEHLCCNWPDRVPHPDYVLSRPGGCEGCLAIWNHYVPSASADEKAKVLDFNLSCITRWRPCTDEEDIMPAVGNDFRAELEQREAVLKRVSSCGYSLPELAQAALHAVVVKVSSSTPSETPGDQSWKVDFIENLGGWMEWKPQDFRELLDRSDEDPKTFAKDQRWIVLFGDGPREGLLYPYPCGVIPYSEGNARNVAAGLALGKGVPERID